MEENVQAQAKPIKIPGPDHPIAIERNRGRVVVRVEGIVAEPFVFVAARDSKPVGVEVIVKTPAVVSVTLTWRAAPECHTAVG